MQHYSNLTRFRTHPITRDLVSSVYLQPSSFVQIIFVDERLQAKKAVPNLDNFWIDTPSTILQTISNDVSQGIGTFMLFCVARNKEDSIAFTCNIITKIKQKYGNDILLICDLCLCGITQDGHCGFIDNTTHLINNHQTVERLSQNALEFAKSGADCIAPSDMRDGRVSAIRKLLNQNSYDNTSIMSYSAKFASNYYSAFRTIYSSNIDENSPLQSRKTYQIDPRNPNDAILSSIRDEKEGADILMVKPIMRYLDIAKDIKKECKLPLSGFHVSTECVSLNLLSQTGYGKISNLFLEDWTAIKRSGVDIIISYNARMLTQWV
ncbi:MAG: porphobilinogen synthase [Candidatus Deianiraeaceae bacterium]|jgi:porphobilinogen synthase